MEVSQNFCQCLGFIEGLSSHPTNLCCQKIASLNAIVKRQHGGARMVCKCIEEYASVYAHRPFDASHIQQLPIKCRTKLSFPISQHMNCSRYVCEKILKNCLN
ncbi:non-specific lipid-transfer protein 13 [Phtheirospermum japonicum]|uniref:Non-specific lipid-transfer protein 13 n=1 Tax=Phtheirospermum japonicum TaxID=374723 RepID=A0A830BRN7_9LAMI|nr:non-specific lipid-transfer protein 13 [Phtheirospermum japonicum]